MRSKVGSSVPDRGQTRCAGPHVFGVGLLRVFRATVLSLCLVPWLTGCSQARASELWQGVVTHVLDGDTIYVQVAGQGPSVSVRLMGIDAPEICQSGGPAARDALRERVQGQAVSLLRRGFDDYGRELAIVYWQGQDVARLLVQQGLAWSYRVGRDPGPYADDQKLARAQRLGLFADPSAELPRKFRQRHGSCKVTP